MSFGTIDGLSDEENKSLKGWYWYDWANQAFALTVLTVLVPQLMSSMFELATGGGTEVGSLVVIMIGWALFPHIDVEEGIRVANQEDIDAGFVSEEE